MKKTYLALSGILCLAGCGNNAPAVDPLQDSTFTVGMECGYPPFNYQTTSETATSVKIEGGYCDGYDVMVAQAIADELNQELEIKKMAWNGLGVALEAGEIDAIIAGMTADVNREEGIDFTSPYYDSHGMVMIVRRNSEEASYTSIQQFSGKNVIGQLNTNYDSVIDQIEGVNHVTAKATYPEMVVALQANDVDGITAEIAVANGIVAANPDLTILTFDQGKGFDCDTSVSIGLKEGSRGSDFFNAAENALASLDEETRLALMEQSINQQGDN